MSYNPTAWNAGNPSFGTDKFNVPSFIQPFDFASQKAEQDKLTGEYSTAIAGQKTVPQLYSQYEKQYQIPELRESMQQGTEAYRDISQQISDIPETTAATTRESLVTAGQAGQMNQAQYAKLAPVAESIGRTVEQVGQMLTQAETNMNTALQMEIAQQKKDLMPFEWKYNLMNINQAREESGWTTTLQAELNRLLSNQSAGLSWTNAEAERANQLAQIEKQYQNNLDLLEKQNEYALDIWG